MATVNTCNNCGSTNISAVKVVTKNYVTIKQALRLITNAKGEFKITFTKQDGTSRHMKCVLPSTTQILANASTPVKVLEVGKGFRSFKPSTLKTVHINKKVYHVV